MHQFLQCRDVIGKAPHFGTKRRDFARVGIIAMELRADRGIFRRHTGHQVCPALLARARSTGEEHDKGAALFSGPRGELLQVPLHRAHIGEPMQALAR
jgi:hypothetical protein